MAKTASAIHLGSIQLFCKAAELESFTAAAGICGVTPAAVSRSIRRIEERLGVRLFVRTTRQIRLSDEGRVYYEKCRLALAQIEEAECAITGNQDVPSGVVRISVPTTYGHYRLLPLLPKFRQRYPHISVEINISNHNIDFVEANYDLAIRLGVPQDSRLVARKLEDATLGVFATPAYLKRHGTPKDVDDLHRHECIQFVLPSTGKGMPWIFKRNGNNIDFAFDSEVRCSDDVLGCYTYAKAGGGIFQIYHFIAEADVDKGELTEILLPFGGRSRMFYVLYQQNRHVSAKVRALVDFLVEELGERERVAERKTTRRLSQGDID
ncbi:MAG: LysR substrate-binding domain-containing protein [Pseudomonadota bacterium]